MYTFPDNLPKIGQIVRFVIKGTTVTITQEALVQARVHEDINHGESSWIRLLLASTFCPMLIFYYRGSDQNGSWEAFSGGKRVSGDRIEPPEIVPTSQGEPR